MALPLTVPNHTRTLPTLGRPSFGLDSPSIAMSAPHSSCSLTILKGHPSHPINAHTPIHHKPNPSSSPSSPSQSRFASSFSSHRPTTASTFDSNVHIHTISDHGILLPFLHRPSEVKELLFDTKANTSLAARLCSVFGGDPSDPLARGKDERWDEMLELLVELDRPLLDDEDWLARAEALVMERSPALWAQLKRCLGAEGVTVKSGREKFDSWAALQSQESPISTPSDASSEAGDEGELAVEVEPLDSLPQSFTERPAGQLSQSSLREASPTSLLSPRSEGGGSPGEVFPMSAGADESAMTSSLEDILEEPATQAAASRPRSHSGKFAGLRISAFSAGASPPVSRRASGVGGSPLPTGAMSPAGSPGTGFAKHRRLSTLMVSSQPATQPSHRSDSKVTEIDASLSPKSTTRRQRGASEASPSHSPFQAATRRRAQSFARSFAELASPTEHLEQLRADHAKSEAERLADDARRISLSGPASAPAATEGGLGLHSGKARGKRVGSVSSRGSVSPPIPGLLPDGRTRHPSGSCGSKDLGESIAAFRATMGMSTSPSPSEKGSEGGDSATRKRKDVEEEESNKPTSRTAESVDAKVSRKASPREGVFDKPKHMQQLESRTVGSAGSGLAVGGGFSLARSGANFRRQSQDAAPNWRSSFTRSSMQQPPAVHRRPGGFVSLAQEYERTRQRRSSDMGGFSVTSNAVGSSEASSLETLGERLDVDRVADAKGEDTPRAGAGPGGVTPRPIKVGGGYPFPNTEGEKVTPRSPSIVFPISPNPSVSRPQAFRKRLASMPCQQAFARVTEVCGAHVSASIQELVTTAERAHMPDEELLEQVARTIGLVDHRTAGERGGREAEAADRVLAEEGYEAKWDAFAAVCRALGVGEYELGAAKARCGPAIDTCR